MATERNTNYKFERALPGIPRQTSRLFTRRRFPPAPGRRTAPEGKNQEEIARFVVNVRRGLKAADIQVVPPEKTNRDNQIPESNQLPDSRTGNVRR